ncbi:MAG: hypothetical protein SFU83_04645 [Meiothermus sp.]|nr:hypothetical protein [Meiothermus sp.]
MGTAVNPNNLERTWYALQNRANGLDEALALALKELEQAQRRAHSGLRVAG